MNKSNVDQYLSRLDIFSIFTNKEFRLTINNFNKMKDGSNDPIVF
jgi:hypothetical protein